MIKEIEDFDGLEALRLEGNTVGVEAARVIAKALEKKSELKVRPGRGRAAPRGLAGDELPLTATDLPRPTASSCLWLPQSTRHWPGSCPCMMCPFGSSNGVREMVLGV